MTGRNNVLMKFAKKENRLSLWGRGVEKTRTNGDHFHLQRHTYVARPHPTLTPMIQSPQTTINGFHFQNYNTNPGIVLSLSRKHMS